MAILEHLIPDAGEHLSRWRETLIHHANGIERRLDGIREAVQEQQMGPGQITRHLTGDGNSGTGNVVEVHLDPPPGFEWELTHLACAGGAGGGLALYLGIVEPSSILFVVPDAQLNAIILNDLPIPSGARLIARFFSQPASADCAIRIVAKSNEAGMGGGEE